MKPDPQIPQPTRQDRAFMRNTLIKLTAAQKLLCAAVILLTALVWYDLLKRLVAFGKGIDYSGLHALGGQTIALLNQYNPFFWWPCARLLLPIFCMALCSRCSGAAGRAS
jgi:hypothetical protein